MNEPPEPRATGDWRAGLRAAGPYVGLGLQLAFTMVFFTGAGYLLDRTLGTSPWLLIAGALVGIAAIFIQIFRISAQMTARAERERRRRQRGGDPPS
ncbi:AtpZ/AtpI family protein [Rhodocaloribacter litoris]|uniref:AtpZ/AtpI family protein n=1 Tax=Rhodocaloribacter litoris TaxID=2558931 RepID=UPI00142053E8|nr:AtpZ/AtpI family protein [Rhodocaloribacter litoris]QXD13992.1 AtpZ/AtpI family protein [Rhodocaloribacter litoris]GIV60823.1 MAG: hypothetical protein KatS3mg043_1912 [Rhodothermaceae bacterium]